MVKVKFTAQLEDKDLNDYYTLPLDRQSGSTAQHAEYIDDTSGYKLVLDGENFAYALGSFNGTVQEMRFFDDSDKLLLTITGASYDGSELVAAVQNDTVLEFALQGDDILIGSGAGDDMFGAAGKDALNGGAGKDDLDGGAGRDRLTGGEASDQFHFSVGGGKDVVTDFDAKGGGNRQDHVYLDSDAEFEVKSANKGRDTVLDFGDGHTLTLLDVRKSDFSDADIRFALDI